MTLYGLTGPSGATHALLWIMTAACVGVCLYLLTLLRSVARDFKPATSCISDLHVRGAIRDPRWVSDRLNHGSFVKQSHAGRLHPICTIKD